MLDQMSGARRLLLVGVLMMFAFGCGQRRSGDVNPHEMVRDLAAWFAEETALLLPAGSRLVIWAADPPPSARGAIRVGESVSKALKAKGFEVVMESHEWPEAPLLDTAALRELQSRHGPLAAVVSTAAGIALDEPPAHGQPRVLVLATGPDLGYETLVRKGHVALAIVPISAAAQNASAREVRERFRVLKSP